MEVTHAFADLEELVRSPSSLQIRLVPEPAVATRGETCRLSWIVEGADEVRLWYTDVRPSAPAPTDWYRVFEEGEPVSAEDERKLPLDQDTAFFMLARAGSQIRGERVLVEIHREPQRIEAEIGCAPTERILEKMTFTPHVALLEDINYERWTRSTLPLHLWYAPPAPPAITITAPTPVIFTDEAVTVSWKVANTNCVTTGETIEITRLLADQANPSGSKYNGGGWGSGWTPSCFGGNPGSRTIQGNQWGSGRTIIHVHASNAAGKSASGSQWIHTLGIPKFEGNCTANRQTWIRASFRKIATKLQEGRVLYDSYLDNTVKAFKKGCLTREGIWWRLLAELQNLNIAPIKCEDTTDPKAAFASFEAYTGRIYLRWKGTESPSEYALCHELVHKAGFHNSLYACGLSPNDIECDADHVASAILGLQPDPC